MRVLLHKPFQIVMVFNPLHHHVGVWIFLAQPLHELHPVVFMHGCSQFVPGLLVLVDELKREVAALGLLLKFVEVVVVVWLI